MGAPRQRREVAGAAVGRRVLNQDAQRFDLRQVHVGRIADRHLDAKGLGAGLDDRDRLRMAVRGDDELPPLAARNRSAHPHRFRGRRGLVQQRRVGQRQGCQVGNERLEGHQNLQTSLGDLRLVRRVLRVPAGVLQDVAADHLRHAGVVVAESDEGAVDLVPVGQGPQLSQARVLVSSRAQGERSLRPDRLRDDGVGQLRQRLESQGLEHLSNRRSIGAEMAGGEGIQWFGEGTLHIDLVSIHSVRCPPGRRPIGVAKRDEL